MLCSLCCRRKGGSQQNRSPRRGTGSTGFRDWPPAPPPSLLRPVKGCASAGAGASASARAREPLLSDRTPGRSATRRRRRRRSRGRITRVSRACPRRDMSHVCAPRPALRVLEPWRCSSTAISHSSLPFDRGLNVKKRLVFGLPHLHATDMPAGVAIDITALLRSAIASREETSPVGATALQLASAVRADPRHLQRIRLSSQPCIYRAGTKPKITAGGGKEKG